MQISTPQIRNIYNTSLFVNRKKEKTKFLCQLYKHIHTHTHTYIMRIGFLLLLLLISDIGIRGDNGAMLEAELLRPTKRPKNDAVAQKQPEEKSFFGFSVEPESIIDGIFGGKVRGNIRIKDFSFNFAFNPWDVVNYFVGDDDDDDEKTKKKKSKY